VNLAEVERGLRPKERRRTAVFLGGLRFLVTDREAAVRAGQYQAAWAQRGRTIHTADALVAGTTRAHGAVLLTHNLDDFPMGDIRVELPEPTDGGDR
jgi:predicted nucleic acid-binding protein